MHNSRPGIRRFRYRCPAIGAAIALASHALLAQQLDVGSLDRLSRPKFRLTARTAVNSTQTTTSVSWYAGTVTRTTERSQSVEVNINGGATGDPPAIVQTMFFGVESNSKKRILLGLEETPVTFPANESWIASGEARSDRTQRLYAQISRRSGVRFYGWAVRAIQNDRVVAVAASSSPLADLVADGAALAAALGADSFAPVNPAPSAVPPPAAPPAAESDGAPPKANPVPAEVKRDHLVQIAGDLQIDSWKEAFGSRHWRMRYSSGRQQLDTVGRFAVYGAEKDPVEQVRNSIDQIDAVLQAGFLSAVYRKWLETVKLACEAFIRGDAKQWEQTIRDVQVPRV